MINLTPFKWRIFILFVSLVVILLTACTARSSTAEVVREAPRVIFRGEDVRVTLTVKGERLLPVCPPPPDARPLRAVLVIDHSGSMAGEPLEEALNAAAIFVGMLNLNEPPSGDQVAIVAFSDTARQVLSFTSDDEAAVAALRTIREGGGTDIAGALEEAARLFTGESSPGVERIIVLLSDGQQEAPGDPVAVAERIKASGVRIVSIALGDADRQTLRAIASEDSFYEAEEATDLVGIYSTVAAGLVGTLGRDVVVQEHVNIAAFTPFGVSGRVVEGGATLRWETPFIGRNGWRTYYILRPRRYGLIPVTVSEGSIQFVGCDDNLYQFPSPTGPRVLVLPIPRLILWCIPVPLLLLLFLWLRNRQPPPRPVAPPPRRREVVERPRRRPPTEEEETGGHDILRE